MRSVPLEKAFAAVRRGEVAGVYYLTGPEDVLKDELVGAIAEQALDPETRAFNLDVRSAADIDGEALHALVETPPMLAARRVVVVRGLDQWRKGAKVWDVLHRYLERPSPSTVLVLTAGGDDPPAARIAGSGCHVAMDGLRPAQVTRWLERRAARAGVSLEPEAAEHLVAAVGGELGPLAVELEKLAAASDSGRITADDVSRLVGVRRGETVHDWADAVLARDTRRAADLLDVVLGSGATGVQLLMILGAALIGVRLARALADGGTPWGRLPGELFGRLRAARPRVRLRDWKHEASVWAGAARRWSGDELDAAIGAAALADRRLKSTTISDERGILMSMLLAFPPAEAAA